MGGLGGLVQEPEPAGPLLDQAPFSRQPVSPKIAMVRGSALGRGAVQAPMAAWRMAPGRGSWQTVTGKASLGAARRCMATVRPSSSASGQWVPEVMARSSGPRAVSSSQDCWGAGCAAAEPARVRARAEAISFHMTEAPAPLT